MTLAAEALTTDRSENPAKGTRRWTSARAIRSAPLNLTRASSSEPCPVPHDQAEGAPTTRQDNN